MRLRFVGILSLLLMVSACRPMLEPMVLPTLVEYPTDIIVTPTSLTNIQPVTETATSLPSNTPTAIPSEEAQIDPPTATITQTATLRPIEPTDLPPNTALPEIIESQYADISFVDAYNLLMNTPLVTLPLENVSHIYNRGRFQGLRDDFLLSVGDCNSESGWYLETLLDDVPPDSGVNASYYEGEAIQSTISHFSDAFAFKGQSVNSGLNAASVLDPFWASVDVCPFGLSPLACDYHLTDSFASLIMFGANDVNVLSTASYEMAMRDIIETTLERDVIPILSTFTVRQIEGTSTYAIGVRFNAVLVRLAEEYQIPLVNFWLATRDLADRGILEDNAHLTVAGFNIRNQLTVEVLTQLRTEIIIGESNS